MELEGSHTASGYRIALIASRFNDGVTTGLVRGARGALATCGVADDDVTLVWVPGAFEIPATARRLAGTGRFDAIVCLGCVIKGDTMHFEYIASATSQGIMNVSVESEIPVVFGVLTVLTVEQAMARAADGPENKGGEAALAAVEMASLHRQLAVRLAP